MKPKRIAPEFVNPSAWKNFDTDKMEFAIDGKRRMYEAHVYPEFALRASDGRRYRPAQDKFPHNFGTVPSLFQIVPALQKDRWRIGFPWHDNLCETGKIKVLSEDGMTWLLMEVSRPWADRFLCFELGVAETAWFATRVVVYGGVSLGTGWASLRGVLDKGKRQRVRP